MRVLESHPRTGLFLESAQMNLDITNFLGSKRRNGQGSQRASRRSVTEVTSRKSRRVSRFLLEVLEDRIVLTTFPVATPLDSGPGSLRAAIAQADQSDGTNRVVITSKVDEPIVLTTGE